MKRVLQTQAWSSKLISLIMMIGLMAMGKSDIWLATANFFKPLEFSIFATLYEMPLLRECLNNTLRDELNLWRNNQLDVEAWCESLIDSQIFHPIFHHWLELQGQKPCAAYG